MKNLPPTNRHTDARRELVELQVQSEACKIVRAVADCTVGNHYHKRKDEFFCLVAGAGTITRDGDHLPLVLGDWFPVWSGVNHSFSLAKGSILVGLATRPFDPGDDYH